jgi:hypothetical protein
LGDWAGAGSGGGGWLVAVNLLVIVLIEDVGCDFSPQENDTIPSHRWSPKGNNAFLKLQEKIRS